MPPRVTMYSKPGCHLCEEMSAVVRRVGHEMPVELEEIDITGDSNLETRYGSRIPVLLVDGRLVAKFRVTAEDLRRALERARGRTG